MDQKNKEHSDMLAQKDQEHEATKAALKQQ